MTPGCGACGGAFWLQHIASCPLAAEQAPAVDSDDDDTNSSVDDGDGVEADRAREPPLAPEAREFLDAYEGHREIASASPVDDPSSGSDRTVSSAESEDLDDAFESFLAIERAQREASLASVGIVIQPQAR